MQVLKMPAVKGACDVRHAKKNVVLNQLCNNTTLNRAGMVIHVLPVKYRVKLFLRVPARQGYSVFSNISCQIYSASSPSF
jgi:hypothetical protein